jgi:hypothetical protein
MFFPLYIYQRPCEADYIHVSSIVGHMGLETSSSWRSHNTYLLYEQSVFNPGGFLSTGRTIEVFSDVSCSVEILKHARHPYLGIDNCW